MKSRFQILKNKLLQSEGTDLPQITLLAAQDSGLESGSVKLVSTYQMLNIPVSEAIDLS